MPVVLTAPLRARLKASASFRFARVAVSGLGLLAAAPLFSGSVLANPTGANVTTGAALVNASSSNKTQIDQKSEDVVIDWSSFNIGNGQTTEFVQPNAQAIVVNRIGGANASQILGTLDANGRVVLINGNGLLFGKNAKVNVGSLIATSTDGTDSDLLAGKFSKAGNQNASVINRGTIMAAAHGTVALVAPNVSNTGTVQAKLGTAALGGANTFTVDFKGDGLVSFAAQGDVNGRASATNTGLLSGARVTMTARSAEGVATGVVNMRGMIEAQSIHDHGGEIVLDAGGGGDTIVAHAKLDASGANLGGAIDIGGWNEASATVDKASVLNASANRTGNGGNISVIADATSFEGRATAQGGKQSGNGGTIETSGYVVDALNARIDTLALHGSSGLWSLDPENVTISSAATINGSISGGIFTPSGDNSVLNAATLEAALSTGNVEVTTGGAGSLGSQAGNITVSAPIAWTNNTLTLNAFGSIAIDKAITGSSATLDVIAGGTIDQTSGGILSIAMLTGSSTGATTLTTANKIATLGAFTTAGGAFELTDHQSLTIDGLVNVGAHLVKIVDTGALDESGAGAIDAKALRGSSAGGSTLTGTNRIADLDAFENSGSGGFALMNAKTLAVEGAVNAGSGNLTLTTSAGNIIIGSGITAGGTIDLASVDTISQNGAGIITAGTLTGSSAGTTTLMAANQILNLGAFGNAGGNLTLVDDQPLTIDGVVNVGANTFVIADTGAIEESGAGAIDARTLGGSSAGGAALNGANQIAGFETFTNSGAGGFALTENESISINAAMNVGTGALTLATMATGQNITIATAQSASTFDVVSAGAITINVPLTVAGTGGLTLDAAGALNINRSISVNGAGNVALDAGFDTSTVFRVSLLELYFAPGSALSYGSANNGGSLWINGQAFTLLYSIDDVRNIANNLKGDYALANSINASSITNWQPLGVGTSNNILNSGNGFSGVFEGLGNTISNLSVATGNSQFAGLFGNSTGYIQNVGLTAGSVTGADLVGGLVGANAGIIDHSYFIGTVGGTLVQQQGDTAGEVGGLAGASSGVIVHSFAAATVSGGNGSEQVGGLVGNEGGTLTQSYATGSVSGDLWVGGLAGLSGGLISNSYATGEVNAIGNSVNNSPGSMAGGLIGQSYGSIINCYATGTVSSLDNDGEDMGGFIGMNGARLNDDYSTGAVFGRAFLGGFVGDNLSVIDNSYSTGPVNTPVANAQYVGGFVGNDEGTISSGYWDVSTAIVAVGIGSGSTSNSGVTGLTTAQFQSGLPAGFDPAFWGENASINGGLPYLLALPPS
jgi:filamentous hemagglutinin family protein